MIKERDLTNFGSREKKTREWVKMAKYHHFVKFVAKMHYFGTEWESTTFMYLSSLNSSSK